MVKIHRNQDGEERKRWRAIQEKVYGYLDRVGLRKNSIPKREDNQ